MSLDIIMQPPVMFAAFGGFAMQLITLMEIRKIPKEKRPDFKDVFYWIPVVASPIMGAGLALAYTYEANTLQPLVAINIGMSAPLILRSMANINPFDRAINVGDDG